MRTGTERDSETSSEDGGAPISKLQPSGDTVFDDLRPAALDLRERARFANESGRATRQLFASQAIQRHAAAETPNRTGLPDRLKSGIEALSGLSMDAVTVHYNSPQPAQLGAHAFAHGTDIHIAAGQEKHLPHEAWHVVQQAQGRVQPTRQMKAGFAVNDDAGLEREADIMGAEAQRAGVEKAADRRASTMQDGFFGTDNEQATATAPALQHMPVQMRLPPEAELKGIMRTEITGDFSDIHHLVIGTEDSADQDSHMAGLKTLIRRQLREITNLPDSDAHLQHIWMSIRNVLSRHANIESVIDSGRHYELTTLSKAITDEHVAARLGKPEDYMVKPANATEKNNIQSLVNSVDTLFSNVNDTHLEEIFGVANVATARAKLANGRQWMNYLHATNQIVTDRSGYSVQVRLGGMSAAHIHILLPSTSIDNPDNPFSKAITFHEAMHSGNVDVRDNGGYIGSPGFREREHGLKLLNAAHYELLAHRLMGQHTELDGPFLPPGATTADGGTVAPLTQTQQALHIVSEKFRKAWTMSLWLRDRFLFVYKNPASWGQPQASGVLTSRSLRYWSKVEQLTVHERPGIDAASPDKAKSPVTQIDLALAESLSRHLAMGSTFVPPTEAAALRITSVYPDGTNWNYVFRLDAEVDALLRWMVGWLGISGDEERDIKTINELSSKGWADIEQDLDPSTF